MEAKTGPCSRRSDLALGGELWVAMCLAITSRSCPSAYLDRTGESGPRALSDARGPGRSETYDQGKAGLSRQLSRDSYENDETRLAGGLQ